MMTATKLDPIWALENVDGLPMLFLIEKSNLSGRWTGRQWWVESETAEQAIEIGKKNWPSKNSTDQFHARPLTEAEFDEFFRLQAEQQGRSSDALKRADRRVAYLDKCRQNTLNALPRNQKVAGSKALEQVAENIDARFREKMDQEYRK